MDQELTLRNKQKKKPFNLYLGKKQINALSKEVNHKDKG